MGLSNVLTFRRRGLRAPNVAADLNSAVRIERMRDSAATLSSELCRQERIVAGIGDLVDTLPDGPIKRRMRRQMDLINVQIARGFATCEVVDGILRRQPVARTNGAI
jgi:hypothetical protein